MSAARNWCFTLNNFNEDDLERFDDLGSNIGSTIKYLVIGREVGESGTSHLQGFIQFTKKIRLSQVKGFVGAGAHCEVMRGTATQASMYCKKDDDWQEFGTIQLQGTRDYIYMRLILAE